MAKNTKKQEGPSFGQEAIAVTGLFGAVFLFLCLVSYSLPILNAASYTAAANWCGTVGHYIAWGLMSLIGISSFWFIILLVFFSVQFFSSTSDFERLPLIFVGSFDIVDPQLSAEKRTVGQYRFVHQYSFHIYPPRVNS